MQTSPTKSQTAELTPAFRRHLRAHKVEAARLREEYGDVQERLSSLVRDSFDVESFAPRARSSGQAIDLDIDDVD
jgi:hypothetical protein